MIVVDHWYGRFGNNIIQLITAVIHAKLLDHNIIQFPDHPMLKTNKIELGISPKSEIVKGRFYDFDDKNRVWCNQPCVMKEICLKYVKPIIKIIDCALENAVYIHMRGGDVFYCPHPLYVQPPLKYYKDIIKNYDKVVLVCEDKRNPCVNELLKLEKVEYAHNAVNIDLSILSNAKHLVIGFSTFGFLAYLLNEKLETLYIPKNFANSMPFGLWGDNVHIIELPNYIEVWKNTQEQMSLMMNY